MILVAVISSFFDAMERKKKYMESETLYFFMFSLILKQDIKISFLGRRFDFYE